MNTQPLTCPFCSGTRIFIGSQSKSFIARCQECGVSIAPIDWAQSFYDDERQNHPDYTFDQQVERGKELALIGWNTRNGNKPNKFDLNMNLHESIRIKEYEDRSGMTDLKERVGSWGNRTKEWMACSPRLVDKEMRQKLKTKHPIAFWVNYGDDETFGMFSFENIEKWLSTPDLLLYTLGGTRERIKHQGK